MTSDHDLEQLVRKTFDGRAQTIQHGPAWSDDPALSSVTSEPEPPSRRWLPALAAAVVLAVVVALAVVRDHHNANTPASSLTPSPSPSNGPNNPLMTCTTTLPAAWKAALTTSLLPAGGTDIEPMSMTTDGTVIAVRYKQNAGSTPQPEVVALRPGQNPELLFSAPAGKFVGDAEMIGTKWLLVGILGYFVQPVDSESPALQQIMLIDLDNGHSTTLVKASRKGLTLSDPTVAFNGKVYWADQLAPDAQVDTVHSYDPETGQYSIVTSGQFFGDLGVGAPGLFVDSTSNGPRLIASDVLPEPVARAFAAGDTHRMGTDGTSYAWQVDKQTIGYWRPGLSTPAYVHVAATDQSVQGEPLIVVGKYVLDYNAVLDMTTNAYVPDGPTKSSDPAPPDIFLSAGNVFGGIAYSSDGTTDPASAEVLRVDTATLPDLSC